VNVVALFKIVPDDTLIKITGSTLDLNVPAKISTYDKSAIEEAIRIKEKHGGKAIGITAGNTDRKAIREALAMGLDEVIAIDMKEQDIYSTANMIADQLKQLNPDLVIGSEATTDSSGGIFPAYLAGLLGLPLISYVKSITIEGKKIRAERNLISSTEIVEAELPLVISVVGEINTPRIPTVKQILESSKKPVKSVNANVKPLVKLASVSPYVIQRKKIIIDGSKMEEAVDKLLSYLRQEGVIS